MPNGVFCSDCNAGSRYRAIDVFPSTGRPIYRTVETIGGTERVLEGYEADDITKAATAILYGTAPALRPTAAESSAATGETQPDAQTEHLFQVGGTLHTANGRLLGCIVLGGAPKKRERASGLGTFSASLGCEEPLSKVLPAGGPVLGRCPSCGADPEDQRLNPYGACAVCGRLGGGT